MEKYKVKNHFRFWYILAALVMGISYYRAGLYIPSCVESGISYCAYSALTAQDRLVAPIKNFFATKKTAQEFEARIRQLQAERDELMASNIALQATMQHENEIQELVEFKKNYAYQDARLAHIIARHFSDQSHFVLIDAGSRAGVTKNMVAVYKNGIVGRVEHVYPHYSKVVLITDRLCKIAASCTKTKAVGIYEGCNADNKAELNRVSHLDSLEPHDLVVSTGQGLIFPQGFGLGYIKHYESDRVTYRVQIEPLFDVRSIQYCYLLPCKESGAQLDQIKVE